jgi:Transposase DDE domain
MPLPVIDRDGAKFVLEQVPGRFPRLARIWADGGYAGQLIRLSSKSVVSVCLKSSSVLTSVKALKCSHTEGRVERTFGWFNRYRRLAKDYKRSIESSEAMLYIAMIRLMLARLTRKQQMQHQQSCQDLKVHSPLVA